jgi:hypothetical protein
MEEEKQEKQCCCFEYQGDNPDCPVCHPKEEEKEGEQE